MQVELYSGNEESTHKTLSLRVRDIQQDDFGEYICYAENKIGHDAEKMVLYGTFVYPPLVKANTYIYTEPYIYNKNYMLAWHAHSIIRLKSGFV